GVQLFEIREQASKIAEHRLGGARRSLVHGRLSPGLTDLGARSRCAYAEAPGAMALLPHQDELPRTRRFSHGSKSSSVGGVGCSWLPFVGSRIEFVISGSTSLRDGMAGSNFARGRDPR